MNLNIIMLNHQFQKQIIVILNTYNIINNTPHPNLNINEHDSYYITLFIHYILNLINKIKFFLPEKKVVFAYSNIDSNEPLKTYLIAYEFVSLTSLRLQSIPFLYFLVCFCFVLLYFNSIKLISVMI